MAKNGKEAGCPELAKLLSEGEGLPSCKLHVFGHIHEARGAKLDGERVSVNAAMSTDKAIVVDLQN